MPGVETCPTLSPLCGIVSCVVNNSTYQSRCFKGTGAHYSDVMMGAIASQITDDSIVHSTVCSGTDERNHQSSASLASNAENVSVCWHHHVLTPSYQYRNSHYIDKTYWNMTQVYFAFAFPYTPRNMSYVKENITSSVWYKTKFGYQIWFCTRLFIFTWRPISTFANFRKEDSEGGINQINQNTATVIKSLIFPCQCPQADLWSADSINCVQWIKFNSVGLNPIHSRHLYSPNHSWNKNIATWWRHDYANAFQITGLLWVDYSPLIMPRGE